MKPHGFWLRRAIAFAAGALLSLAFAPHEWWPLAIACPAVLFALWEGSTPRAAAWLGFWFAFGTFTAGTWWLYVSIHVFGQAPIWLALLLMLALVTIMACYQALLGFLVARFLPRTGLTRWLLGIPALWLLIEWLRGWLFSGFSWLSLGYSQTGTWLAAWAPVAGVYWISLLLLLSAGALLALWRGNSRQRAAAAVALLLPWIIAWPLRRLEWTQPSGPAVGVAVLQGAIPQDEKWLEENRTTTLLLYRDLTRQALGTPLIVWPEAAPPDLANNLTSYLGEAYGAASAKGSSLVLGVVRADDAMEQYYNSVIAMSDKVSWYNKQHLVPFAEVFPVPAFVRSWLRLMSLPYSDFTRGAADQPPLPAAGLLLSVSICYEDAYGSSQLAALRTATALVNVTNDAWFGRSSARYQHLQISRMRAIEAQRFLIRAANDGVSAVIGPHGEIVAQAVEYKAEVLRANVVPRSGLPFYVRVANFPVILLCLAALLLALRRARQELSTAT